MKGARQVLFFASLIVCTFAQFREQGDVNEIMYVPGKAGYIAGPLPLLRLKKAGFDISHTLRQMESPSPDPTPSPSPSPSPKCKPEEEALKDACTEVKKREIALRAASKALTAAQMALIDKKDILENRKETVNTLRGEVKALEAEIARLEASLRDAERSIDEAESAVSKAEKNGREARSLRLRATAKRALEGRISDQKAKKDTAELNLRVAERLKDEAESTVSKAEKDVKAANTRKEEARERVTQADAAKKAARAALDACLSSRRR